MIREGMSEAKGRQQAMPKRGVRAERSASEVIQIQGMCRRRGDAKSEGASASDTGSEEAAAVKRRRETYQRRKAKNTSMNQKREPSLKRAGTPP